MSRHDEHEWRDTMQSQWDWGTTLRETRPSDLAPRREQGDEEENGCGGILLGLGLSLLIWIAVLSAVLPD